MIPLARLCQLYDRAYFLDDCEGHEEFRRSNGTKLSRRMGKCLRLVAPRPGERIVDVGCGRGELALALARAGAEVAALDPAPAALALSREIACGARVHLVRARGEQIPLPGAWADAIVLSDVVEHLPAASLGLLLLECQRVLSDRGRLVVHTEPNRRLLDVTVPFLATISRLWGVRIPRDLRAELSAGAQREYHVNEQTRGSLARALRRNGFTIDEIWLEGSYPLHRIFGDTRIKRALLPWFRRSSILKEFLAGEIYAIARREQ